MNSNAFSANRVVVDDIEVLRLADASRNMEVSIAPSIGNNAFEFKVNGVNLLWSPYTSLIEFRAKPVLCGIPFLAPWANRLDQEAFFANNKRYALNPGLGNLR
jgi:aldose 1-epimerase